MYEILAYSGRYVILFLAVVVSLSLLILSKKQDLNIKRLEYSDKKENLNQDEENEFERPNAILIVKNLMNPNSKETKVEFYDTLTVGRDDGNNLVLRDRSVSKEHAVIFKNGSKFYVEDLNSTNGTYVNGKRIKRSMKLQKGSKIQIGVCEITLHI